MLLKHNTSLLFLFSLFLFFSCQDKVQIHVRKQIEKAIEIGEDHPEQALMILDSISNPQELDEECFMLYQIADVKANRNRDKLIREDQTKLIVKAAAFFEQTGDAKNAFLANYYAAISYNSQYSLQSNLDQELTHYLKAYFYAKNLNDSLMMGKTLYNIGLMYYDQQVYDSTNVYLSRAIPLLKKYPKTQVQAYRLFAFSFYLKDELDKALRYLDEGRPLLTYQDNKKYAYLYNILYGIVYKTKGEYKKAVGYLNNNMIDSIPENEKERTAINLLQIYTLTHNLDSASYYRQLVEPKLNKIDENELLLFGFKVLKDYYYEIGNNDRAEKYINLFNQRLEIIDSQNEAETLLLVDKEVKMKELEKAQRENQFELWLSGIILLLVIGIFFFIMNRIKVCKGGSVKLHENEINKLQFEIDKKKQEYKL